jgi:lysophospholipase L1-like esterase
VAVAEENERGAWVDTDDLNNKKGKDDLHYTAEGYKTLGERFAEKAIELVKQD